MSVLKSVANAETHRRDDDGARLLFPPDRHPYYIVTPSYKRTSAGRKALHLLCHTLNLSGQIAFAIRKKPYKTFRVNPNLLTPVLTQEIAKAHFVSGLTPIVVYPETTTRNPFRAPLVVRYVLNFPGLLGGDSVYSPDELVFGYSAVLAAAAGAPSENVLFIPVSDTKIFYPKSGQKRSGSCFYAGKYQEIHKGKLLDITAGSVEIKRSEKDGQTPEEIAELFHKSELFYAYENTALAIEAMMCGCPTVFLPNPWLTESIGAKELGWDGFAWGTEESEIKRAKETVDRGYENYLLYYERFWKSLDHFIAVTQGQAKVTRHSALAFNRWRLRAWLYRHFGTRRRILIRVGLLTVLMSLLSLLANSL